MTYIPYTYRITCPDGRMYYGVKYANNRRDVANPSTLWVNYFTSCKIIKDMLNIVDASEFKIEIRKTFSTKEEAISWESRVNKYTTKSPKYLNNSFMDGRDQSKSMNGMYGKSQSAESKMKMVSSRRSRFGGDYYDKTKITDRSYMTVEWLKMSSEIQRRPQKLRISSETINKVSIATQSELEYILKTFDKFEFPTDYREYKTLGSRKTPSSYFYDHLIDTEKFKFKNHTKHPKLLIKNILKTYRPIVLTLDYHLPKE